MIQHIPILPALLAIAAVIGAVVLGLLIAGPPDVRRSLRACFAPPPIDGDADFQARVTRAWELAERAPNAHILGATKRIVQGDPNGLGGAYCLGDTTVITQDIASPPKKLAATLIHEAAHAHYRHSGSTPETEHIAMTEENKARRALGIPETDPNDFSWWEKNHPGWPGGTATPQPRETPPAPAVTVVTPTETMVTAVAQDMAQAANARPGGLAGFVWDAKQLERERRAALDARRAAGYIA